MFVISLVVYMFDQLTKFIVLRFLPPQKSIPVIPDIFHITHVQNPGAAFGMLANRTWFFVLITLVVVIAVIFYYRHLAKEQGLMRWGLALMVGGALGNLTDRLRTGLVTDFLDFRFWPVFNLADTAIVIGVILVCWELLRSIQSEQKEVER